MRDHALSLYMPLIAAASRAGGSTWTSVNALSTLLIVESFLFGFVNVVIGVVNPSEQANRLISRPRTFAFWAASLISGVALGAVIAWCDLFVSCGSAFHGKMPHHFGGFAPAFVILVAIVAQPLLVWYVARGVPKPAKAPPLAGGGV